MSTRLNFVQSVWKDMLTRGGVEKLILPGLQITTARQNFVRAELVVEQNHLNRLGIMHGGVLSTLVDVGGSLAVASRGMFMTGVTTDMATTFLSSAGKTGDKLSMDCYLDKVGHSLAFTHVEIYRLMGNHRRLAARGNHSKHIGNARDSPLNVEDEWEDDVKQKL